MPPGSGPPDLGAAIAATPVDSGAVDTDSARLEGTRPLDNLKTYLIAGVIAAHAVMGYSDFGSWTYQDVQEATLSPVVEVVFVIATVTFGALYMMGLLFLLSGLMTHESLVRKGTRRFVTDRLLRLGVPFALYTLVVWPVLEFLLLEPFFHRGSYWAWFTDTEPVLDNGPMWFVGVLLVYSLGLAAWRVRHPLRERASGELRGRTIAVMAAAVGVTTFLIRIASPANSDVVLNSHLWAWPEYLAMFGLGVVAARRGWLRPVPAALSRQVGIASAVVMVILPIAILTAEPLGLTEDAYFGGWSLPGFIGAMSEGLLAVVAPIWVLGFAQRRLDTTGPIRRKMARCSYAAFMLQGPVLVALALALRPIDLSGDLKALIVATLGIVGSFALAWPLVTRTPLRKVL
jgi:hypothetical protein